MEKTINIKIDNVEVQVPDGTSILDAAKKIGVEIPTLCHHEKLKPFSSCFVCVVESVKTGGNLVTSCSTTAMDGMEILTDSYKVRQSRKLCLELLLSDHAGDCLAPCQAACPANTPIPAYLDAISKGDPLKALKIIKTRIPFAASIGRVCPRPCETACRRNNLEGAAAICSLKRYAADEDLNSDNPFVPECAPDTGKKIAIIGAGPAGLSAGYYLRQKGHAVTVFDRHDRAGGMLAFGIPDFRLPRNTLAAEVATIIATGIDVRYNVDFGTDVTTEQLKKEGYDAIYIAIGAQGATAMRVSGENLERVYSGVKVLDNVASDDPPYLGNSCVVVGGGSTAIDAARSAKRLGVKDVYIMYRRTRHEMPAHEEEVDDMVEEGVELMELTAPLSIESDGEKLKVTSLKMRLGDPDSSGRRSPVKIPGSEFSITCDSMVSAIGQAIDGDCLKGTKVETYEWGTIKVNPKTFMTTEEGVFAGGDCAVDGNGRIAVEAIGMGRRAAEMMDLYVNGRKLKSAVNEFTVEIGSLAEIPAGFYKGTSNIDRTKMLKLKIADRLNPMFPEVEQGYCSSDAIGEASRCLNCGCAEQDICALRAFAFEYDANPKKWKGGHRDWSVDDTHKVIQYESGKCILCGACVRVCEEVKGLGAICFTGRGFPTRVQPNFGNPWEESTCDGCKMCVEVCPTGAILEKLEDGTTVPSHLTRSALSEA